MTGHLTKARVCAQFVTDDLQRALHDSDPVAGIVLLKLIEQAATLERGICTLLEALEEAKHG